MTPVMHIAFLALAGYTGVASPPQSCDSALKKTKGRFGASKASHPVQPERGEDRRVDLGRRNPCTRPPRLA